MPEYMNSLFASGDIVWILAFVMAVEAAAFCIYNRMTGRGLRPSEVFANLLSGFLIMLALALALKGVSWLWIGAALLASSAAHMVDLYQRNRRETRLAELELGGANKSAI